MIARFRVGVKFGDRNVVFLHYLCKKCLKGLRAGSAILVAIRNVEPVHECDRCRLMGND